MDIYYGTEWYLGFVILINRNYGKAHFQIRRSISVRCRVGETHLSISIRNLSQPFAVLHNRHFFVHPLTRFWVEIVLKTSTFTVNLTRNLGNRSCGNRVLHEGAISNHVERRERLLLKQS